MASTPRAPHREEIKAAIRMRGTTMAELSRHLGYTDEAVRISLTKPWPRLQAKIAEYLGKSPHQLWPQWYLPDGTCTARRRANANSGGASRNVYRQRAA